LTGLERNPNIGIPSRNAAHSSGAGIRVLAFAAVAISAACGSPAGPTVTPPPDAAPVITSLDVSRTRIEIGESVEVTAAVEDPEGRLDDLQYVWTSDGGQFSGAGAIVTWTPAAALATPADPVLTLTVVDSYQALDAQGRIVNREHRVSGSTTLRVHDSRRELGDLGLSFLQLFADSSVSPEVCVESFSDSCDGKDSELRDIRQNRDSYTILSSQLGTPDITSLDLYEEGVVFIPCAFESRIRKCPDGSDDCVVGYVDRVSGDCRLRAVYEQSRWWLCESRFFAQSGTISPSMRAFFGSDARW
jgi:hypothetical protein